MLFTDNPITDFHRHDAEQEAELELLPICSECGHRIQDEHCFVINDMPIHESCMIKNYRVATDDLMG